jgi:hypothetical protein
MRVFGVGALHKHVGVLCRRVQQVLRVSAGVWHLRQRGGSVAGVERARVWFACSRQALMGSALTRVMLLALAVAANVWRPGAMNAWWHGAMNAWWPGAMAPAASPVLGSARGAAAAPAAAMAGAGQAVVHGWGADGGGGMGLWRRRQRQTQGAHVRPSVGLAMRGEGIAC